MLYICALAFLTGCGNDNPTGGGGSQATISSFSPAQVSRGQQHIEGLIQGTNLTGIVAVSLGDGLVVEEFSSTSSTQIEVRFSVTANAAAGQRTITVGTSHGAVTAGALLSVSNNKAPSAAFSSSPSSGARNTTFTFDASGSEDSDGTVDAYRWDFGDGETDNGRIVTHKFSKLGTFEVKLTITDNDQGSDSAIHEVEVLEGKAPTARFFVTPETGDVRTVFTFNASNSADPDGSITAYKWNFGDGATATGMIVEHQYHTQKVYEVELTVTDNTELEGYTIKSVSIAEFDEAKAKKEIEDVVVEFFELYSKLEKLDADTIVQGFAVTDECKGRDREKKIIEEQQEILKHTQATILGPIDILIHENHVEANAVVSANFKWEEKDGTTGEGDAEHDFTLIFLDDRWQICNFTVIGL